MEQKMCKLRGLGHVIVPFNKKVFRDNEKDVGVYLERILLAKFGQIKHQLR